MIRSLKRLYHLLVAIVATIWFGFPSRKLTVIGVTGTDGKTTTTTLIYEILKASGHKTSMITSVHAVIAGKKYDTGFHVTTPNAWWIQKYLREAANHGDTHFVLEVTSHGLDQHRVFGVQFAVGVLTNVTHEHLDWHGSFDQYVQAKLSLLTRAKVAVVNRDEVDVYTKVIDKLRQGKFITYGILHDAMVTSKTHPFKTKLPGQYNKYNCLAAIAVSDHLGIEKKSILSAVSAFEGIVGRMEVIQEKPFRVIVDFAHTPNAITQVLRTVRPVTKKRLIHVFGSAGLRDRSKRPLMGAASSAYADIIVLTEEDYRTEDVNNIIDQIAMGIEPEKNVHRFPKRGDAIAFAINQAKSGDTVIITGKGHEKSLCRGKTEYPWSDQEVARKNLRQLQK